MTFKKLVFSLFVLLCQFVLAQDAPMTNLDEVVISDKSLYSDNKSQSIQVLNDSVISKNQPLLTNLLNYNSVLYFKEYGRGMTSTVSFRGTTTSQTAVIWNGINVNSLLNGSADFNTFSPSGFNTVSVKAGGGSVSYGSGAIGGSVHLMNKLDFKNQFENDLRLDYGSFNTVGVNYKMALSEKKWSTQIGLSRYSSDNDYDYVDLYTWKGEQRKNENGQYVTSNLSANLGYQFTPTKTLTFYSQSSNTDRNQSLVSESDNKTKYVNSFSRNLLEYSETQGRFTSNYKVAYLTEQYRYYPDIARSNYTFGQSESLIGKLDFGYQLLNSIDLNAIIDYSRTKGFGTNIDTTIRDIGAVAVKAVQRVNEKWQNELGFRKEATSDYQSPFLFSLGSSYAFSSFYTLKTNFSRNFRIPTFNDLYWSPGGNPDLKPESSYQAELGNVFKYKNISLTETIYYIKIDDLIRWIPMNGSVWSPENVDKVNTYGSETLLSWAKTYGKNNFALNGTYAYTVSKNRATDKQLFFVPYHKATASFAYAYAKFSVDYQYLYNGFVYTRSDNDPNEIIDAYEVSNLGFAYDFTFLDSSKVGFQVLNLFNEKYKSVEDRPMVGRNFNMYITLKF